MFNNITLQDKQKQRNPKTRHGKPRFAATLEKATCWAPRYFLLGTPVVLVGHPGSPCWAPRYVAGGVKEGQKGCVFGLFARISGGGGRPPDRDPCWAPRYFLLGTPVYGFGDRAAPGQGDFEMPGLGGCPGWAGAEPTRICTRCATREERMIPGKSSAKVSTLRLRLRLSARLLRRLVSQSAKAW